MTEAYKQGFIEKCAEQGVDGARVIAELEKQAKVGMFGKYIVNPAKRYWELLSGNGKVLSKYNKLQKNLIRKGMDEALRTRNEALYKDMETLMNGFGDIARNGKGVIFKVPPRGKYGKMLNKRLSSYGLKRGPKGSLYFENGEAIANELGKVDATRLATLIGGAGLGGGALMLGGSGRPDNTQDRYLR